LWRSPVATLAPKKESRPRSTQQIENHETMQPANWRRSLSFVLALTSNFDDLIQSSPTGGTWVSIHSFFFLRNPFKTVKRYSQPTCTQNWMKMESHKIENDFTFLRHPSGNRWPLRTCPGRPLRTVVGARRNHHHHHPAGHLHKSGLLQPLRLVTGPAAHYSTFSMKTTNTEIIKLIIKGQQKMQLINGIALHWLVFVGLVTNYIIGQVFY
jgi:hypothetical protein